MIDRMPDRMKLPFALWTRDAVKLLIKRCHGVEMPIRTVGEYLKRWGFTPQKPVKRTYEQNVESVKKWLDTDYPLIATRRPGFTGVMGRGFRREPTVFGVLPRKESPR